MGAEAKLRDIVVDIRRIIDAAASEIDRIMGDRTLADGYKSGEAARIRREVEEQVGPLRTLFNETIEERKLEINAELYRMRQKLGPSTAEEWQEATSRAPFVSKDVRGVEGDNLVTLYRTAAAAGDQMGAWLIYQHALDRLPTGQPGDMSPAAISTAAVRAELVQLVEGKILEREKALKAGLAEIQIEFGRVQHALFRNPLMNQAAVASYR